MHLTLDSSVIVAALRKQEVRHQESRTLLEKIKAAEHIAIEPLTALIEVAAAIRRRTGSRSLARRVAAALQTIDTFHFLELEAGRAEEAIDIAIRTGIRGMDAIMVQIAREFGCPLVSLDEQMLARVRGIVEVKAVDDLMTV